MEGDERSALIAAKPGWVRDGLQSLLASIPRITHIHLRDDRRSALQMMADQQPIIVLFGSDFPIDEVLEMLHQIKGEWANTRCIVLIEDIQQEQSAKAAGADAVLHTGFLAARLIALVESLLLNE